MKSKTILRTMCLAVPLAIVGCGGGGNSEPAPQGGTTPSNNGGSNGNGSSTDNNTSTTPVITLSESALTIAAGEEGQVSIEVTDDKGLTSSSLGCGDNLTMIISSSLPSDAPTSYEVSPRIVAAKLSANTTSSCTFTFGDADGNEESVEIKVDITGVNILPTVSAGDDVTVKSGEEVTLTASAADENSDGTIASYQWKQTAGTAATLTSADSKTLSLTPTASATETLTFEVIVTDNAGGTATDTVDVTVLPISVVNVFFPIEGSTTDVTVGEELVITGNVQAETGAEIKVVKLTHDSDTVDATVDEKGNWRAALTLAAGDDLSIDITAQDSNGVSHQTDLKLNRAIDFSGESVFTRSQQGVVGAAVDYQNNILYIQSQGDTVGDTKLFAFDTESHALSEFSFTDKDISSFDLRHPTSDIEWNKSNNTLYIANQESVFALDIKKKERTMLDANGFFDISDIDIDAENNKVYVVDNQFNELSTIDLSNGEKEAVIFGDNLDGVVSVDYVAADNSLVLSKFFGGNNPFLRVQLSEQPSVTVIGDDNTNSIEAITFELAVTRDGTKAYFIDQSSNLKVIEFSTQKVEVLQTDVAKVSGAPTTQNALELDEDKGLLYIVAEDPSGDGFYVLNVVDIATNKMVKKPL